MTFYVRESHCIYLQISNNVLSPLSHRLINQILRLTKNCLSYDFIGTSSDETTDDSSTIQVNFPYTTSSLSPLPLITSAFSFFQIPTNWRPAFLDLNYLTLFFDLYHMLPSRLSSLALSTLVQITSVRRSLFSNSERAKFLGTLVANIKNILENSQGLSDPDNYHEFCRLLARLKTNYQLGELVVVECYAEVIQLIAKFTVQSLQVGILYMLTGVRSVLNKYLLCLFLDVAICTKQRSLSLVFVATDGGLNPICTSSGATSLGYLHTRGHKGLYYI